MKSTVHFASITLLLARARRQLPCPVWNQKPDIEFHAPFLTSLADNSQEFRDKYFFGDWRGERSNLRIGTSNICLAFHYRSFWKRGWRKRQPPAITIWWDSAFLSILTGYWVGMGTIHVGYAARTLGMWPLKNYVGNSFPDNLPMLPTPSPPDLPFLYARHVRRKGQRSCGAINYQ